MPNTNDDREAFLKKCKESVEDVLGWKMLIFLPDNFEWRFFIVVTVLIEFTIDSVEVFYKTKIYLDSLWLCCELSYLIDTTCSIMQHVMRRTRKLRHGKLRPIFLLFIDCVSLVPFETIFRILVFSNEFSRVSYLRLSNFFRIYHLIMTFSDVKIWVFKVQTYFIVVFLEMFLYLLLLTHILSCALFLTFSEEYQSQCKMDLANCLIENEFTTLAILCQTVMHPSDNTELQYKKWELMSIFFIGFLVTFGFVIPTMLFVGIKFLRKFFEFSNRLKQLNLLVNNMIPDGELKGEILNYFLSTKNFPRENDRPDILYLFPLCFHKSIFCDIYWDAMNHSEFLRVVSRGCKRYISLYMKTEFILPKTELNLNNRFIYLESGLVQIMAIENDKRPVLGLSSGTVLGEINLFLNYEKKTIVRTGKFSVIHILDFSNFFRVLLKFPKDAKKIISQMKLRFALARATRRRKMEICPQFLHEDTTFVTVTQTANIKWLKNQYQAILDVYKACQVDRKNCQEGTLIYSRTVQNLWTELQKTSAFLPLLAINKEIVSKYEAVCLKMSFPWFMDPNSSFVLVWDKIIVFIIFIALLVCPFYLGWFPVLPTWFIDIMIIISFFYTIDVIIKLLTAVKVKSALVSNTWTVISYRCSTLSFYVDIFAAIPMALIGFLMNENVTPFKINIYSLNALLKSYKLFDFLNAWNYKPQPGAVLRTICKCLFWLAMVTYIVAALLNLSGVECIFYDCSTGDWYEAYKQIHGEKYKPFVSMFLAVYMAFDIGNPEVNTNVISSFVITVCCVFVFYSLRILFQAEMTAIYFLDNYYELTYKNLMKFVFQFLNSRGVTGRIQKRVMDTMEFQWYYDHGDYLTQSKRILERLSKELMQKIDREHCLPTIRATELFADEDEEYQLNICKRIHSLALPANSVLIKFGTLTMNLYIIHRGFVLINSFLPGDLVHNVGTRIVAGHGQVFPVVAALNQKPAPVTVRTLTDCELLVIRLEDTISTMIFHGVFKDVVEAVKVTNLSSFDTAKLGLTSVEDPFKIEIKEFEAAFAKHGRIGKLFRFIFLKTMINPEGNYLRWECVRSVLTMFELLTWSMIFGTFTTVNVTVILYLLMILDVLAVGGFFVRFYVIYYNKDGIYITHPLSTSLHYLKTTFLVDILSCIPRVHFFYLQLDVMSLSLGYRSIHVGLRSLVLYKFVGILNYLNYFRRFSYGIVIFKYASLLFIAIHYCANICVYLFHFEGRNSALSFHPNATYPTSPTFYVYIYELETSLLPLFGIPFFVDEFTVSNIIYIAILAVLGLLLQIYLFSKLTVMSLSQNFNFTVYQYYMKSFSKFLTAEHADDQISDQTIAQIEYEWEMQKGENLRLIFSRFPHTLHEDMMYPLYRITLSAVRCLSRANEAFYRELSRHMEELHLRKGSIIIFSGQVQGDIFFIHKGTCFVENLSKPLFRGSMIGDIRNKKLMKNTVVAKTHVDLLKITSSFFMSTISNFYYTKLLFDSEIVKVDDFVESIYIQTQVEDLARNDHNESDNAEAQFESFGTADSDTEEKPFRAVEETKKSKIINPSFLCGRVIKAFFLVVATVTIIFIPIFAGLQLLAPVLMAAVYFLDILWLFKIIISLRTAYVDPKTGHYVIDKKAITHKYTHSWMFLADLLSILPIEVIPTAYFLVLEDYNGCCAVPMFYCLRLLRVFYIKNYIKIESKKLSTKLHMPLIIVFGSSVVLVNIMSNLAMIVRRESLYRLDIQLEKCFSELNEANWTFLEQGYLCTLNDYFGTSLTECLPKTAAQIVFRVFCQIHTIFFKSFLVIKVLMVLYVANYNKSDLMYKLTQLEAYLLVRGLSPSLLQRTRKYFCDLINTYKEGSMPAFLINLPPFLKINLMEDLYVNHLANCYVFHGVDPVFLKQLAARMEKQVFFPGDYLVETGDVDENMYFVHRGQVSRIQPNKEYPTLEIVDDIYEAGEVFGVPQGIYRNCPHKYTYRAKILTEVLVLNFNSWLDLRMAYRELTEQVFAKVRTADL